MLDKSILRYYNKHDEDISLILKNRKGIVMQKYILMEIKCDEYEGYNLFNMLSDFQAETFLFDTALSNTPESKRKEKVELRWDSTGTLCTVSIADTQVRGKIYDSEELPQLCSVLMAAFKSSESSINEYQTFCDMVMSMQGDYKILRNVNSMLRDKWILKNVDKMDGDDNIDDD